MKSISYTCFLILIICSVVSGHVLAGNLIKHSSFEAGKSEFFLGDTVHIVQGDAYHGSNYAISMSGRVPFNQIALKNLPSTYTLSIYVRSAGRPGRVSLAIFGNKWKELSSDVKKIGGIWQRVSISGTLGKKTHSNGLGPGNVYFPVLFNYDKVPLHIDAVQWEMGDLSDYMHQKTILAGISVDKHANVFLSTEDINIAATVANMSGGSSSLKSIVKAIDFFGNTREFSHVLHLGGNRARKIDVSSLVSGTGYYDIYHIVEDMTGVVVAEAKTSVAINAVHPSGKQGIPRFGVGIKGLISDDPEVGEMRWRQLDNANIDWVRVFPNWRLVERDKGKYDWARYDREINEAKAHNKKILASFGNPEPKWLKSPGHRPGELDLSIALSKRLAFIENTVKRYAEKVDSWEIFNEPFNFYARAIDKGGFIKGYMELHKQTLAIIRKYDPEAKVLGNFSSFRMNDDQLEFMGILKEQGILGRVGFAIHIYGDGRGNKLRSTDAYARSFGLLRPFLRTDRVNKPVLWHTEGAVNSDDTFDSGNMLRGEYRQHTRKNTNFTSESNAAGNYIKGLHYKMKYGIEKDFYLVMGLDGPYASPFSMFRDGWKEPKKVYAAYQAFTEILADSSLVKEVEGKGKGKYFLFDQGEIWLVSGWGSDRLLKLQMNNSNIAGLYDFMGNSIDKETIKLWDKEKKDKIIIWPHYMFLDKYKLPRVEHVERELLNQNQ
ncbi:MAG: endo-1,4-beta-xylanase [Gammaproteobacteria bacterium]|nr:endo-1,4-beta-xylanase [Gammaproteobacteria bacterium]